MSRLRILVVDDNPSDIFLLRRALNAQGEEHDLEVVPDGELALEFVENERKAPRAEHPCVILLDLHLPKFNGMEVLRALRHEPVLSHLHVMVLTTLATPREEVELKQLGAVLRLKPSNLDQFAELAAEVIAICKGLRIAA